MVNILTTKLLILNIIFLFILISCVGKKLVKDNTYVKVQKLEWDKWKVQDERIEKLLFRYIEDLENCENLNILEKYPKIIYLINHESQDSNKLVLHFSQNIPYSHNDKTEVLHKPDISLEINKYLLCAYAVDNNSILREYFTRTDNKLVKDIKYETDEYREPIITAFPTYIKSFLIRSENIELLYSNFCN